MIRMAAEHEAVNMPIQGTAADILKQAMIDVDAALARQRRPAGAEPHDPDGTRRTAVRGAGQRRRRSRRSCRTDAAAFPLNVPLTVDVGVGRNWTDAKP